MFIQASQFGVHLLLLTIDDWRQTSNIVRTKSQQLNVSGLVLQMFLPNPLNPGVKSRMKT